MGLREGPETVKMVPIAASAPTISATGNHVSNQAWATVAAKGDVVLHAGKWYYELRVEAHCTLRFGWCTPRHAAADSAEIGELGADAHSWAWDGRATAYHAGARTTYGSGEFRQGDVLGCGVDFDRRTVSFWKGGKCLGAAFSALQAIGGVSPVVYIERRGDVSFDFAATPKGADFALYCPLQLSPGKAELAKMDAFYQRYFDASQQLRASSGTSIVDAITGDGTLQLAADLGAEDVSDPTLMIVAYKFASSKTWEFTRDEFIGALTVYHIDDLDTLKKRVVEWRRDLDDTAIFKDFYFFLFDYLKEDANKTVLTIDEAQMVWTTLDMAKRWPLFAKFAVFLAESGVKSVNRDAWRQLLEFARVYPHNIDNFDAEGAWPLLYDNFVEWLQEQ